MLGRTELLAEFKSASRSIWLTKTWRFYLLIALALNILNWLAMFFIYRAIGDNLTVLHYNTDFGIDLVGQRPRLFLNPLFGLVLLIINLISTGLLIKNKNFKICAHWLLSSTAFVNLLLIIATATIYLINFR
jgi:hypothetical protein